MGKECRTCGRQKYAHNFFFRTPADKSICVTFRRRYKKAVKVFNICGSEHHAL
jgi:hypothetical protein